MNQLSIDASQQRARLLLGLNPEQAQVVEHDTGPAVVAAVPGAGKTTALVRRIAYLANVRGVDPTRILCTTFAKKAALEMTTRATALLGSNRAQVSTFHSLCNRILRDEMPGHASWELDEKGDKYRLLIKKAIGHEHMKWDRGDPNAVAGFIGLAKADGLHPTDAGIDALARLCTRRSRGKIDSHERLINAYLKVEDMRRDAFLMTFDDWLIEARDALQADENARRRWAALYDYVQVDEVQDTSKVQFDLIELLCRDHRNLVAVGDAQQCVSAGTMVETTTGTIPVEQLHAGSAVMSLRNGSIAKQHVNGIKNTGVLDCVEIVTDGGRRLTMSLNHKIWATVPRLEQSGQMIIYLMYRSDLGYRVGITNRDGGDDEAPWGHRMQQETAERLWIIDLVKDRETALRDELALSLKYGIPTLMFNAEERGINQARVNSIFSEFGKNGEKLLADRGLMFEFPHCLSAGSTRAYTRRRVVRVTAHGDKGTAVSLEWTGDDVATEGLRGFVGGARTNGKRVRRWFPNYRHAIAFAGELALRSNGVVKETIAVGDERLVLFNAGALMPSMRVAVRGDSPGGFVVDRIKSVTRCRAECFDLDVDDASNFIGNGILSHNSIFAFRGSKPALFRDFPKTWDATVIEMQRNYRSGSAIIAHAGDVFDDIPDTIRSGPRLVAEMPHDGSVTVRSAATFATEAGDLAEELLALHADGMAWRDVAVIYRTNARSRAFEEAFTAAKIPYRVSGGAFFYARREVATLIAYLRVAWRKGATMDDTRKSLFGPNRYLGKAYFSAFEAVADAHKKTPGASPVSIRELAERACGGMGRVTSSQRSSAATWGALLDGLRADVAAGGKQARPAVMLQRVLDATGFIAWLRKDEGSDSPENDRAANVAELIRAASSFATVGELLDHVAVQQAAFKGTREEAGAEPADAVLLSSIHGVKGLEFPRVYLVACCENILPHFFADDVEEERRLYYVAVTRAKDALTVSYARADVTGETMRRMEPSEFLAGLIASQGHADDGAAPESRVDEPDDADDDGSFDDQDEAFGDDDAARSTGGVIATVIPLFGRK